AGRGRLLVLDGPAGIGKSAEARLKRDGFTTIADLQRADPADLMRRYGSEGMRLSKLSRGLDTRRVSPDREAKTVSSETTFHEDLSSFRALERRLWNQTERVSARLKTKGLAGSTVTLKLKTADFRLRTRARSLGRATALAEEIFAAGRNLLIAEADGERFRLLGIGVSNLMPLADAVSGDLIERGGSRAGAREAALDRLRAKFGDGAVVRGLVFGPDEDG
ncbi:MAG: DNA polymerase IV, partial [Rhizobiales bacterium]|nr:DNA polymerase IV [Hyphomicrobiales bacterium]